MDWLNLVLGLLAVASNIEAQQGYDYPKPKTPFPGDVSTNVIPGTEPELGGSTQRPFGTQQPSGGYSVGGQPGTPTGSSGTFGPQQSFGGVQPGTPSGTKRPFGTQQPSAGYSTGGQPGAPTGTSGIFGTQQPSGGIQPGTPSDVQKPSGGYSFGGQPGTPTGTSGTFRTQQPSGGLHPGAPTGNSGTFGPVSGNQRRFGAQQASAGYPSGGQTGTPSSSPDIRQPSGGYPGKTQPGTSGGTQGTFGTQQPSVGFPDKTQPGTSSGIQRPFGTQGPFRTQSSPGSFESQQPFNGYTGSEQLGVSGDRTFGSQQPSTIYPNAGQSGAVFGTSSVTQRPFVTQQPGRSGAGRRIDFDRPGLGGSTVGLSGEQRPETTRPSRPQGQDVNGPSTGSQQGYNYPSPQRPFSGTGQTGSTGTETSTAPGSVPFGLEQRPSVVSSEGPSGGNGFTGNAQFPFGRESSGSFNGYTTPGLERPAGQQFPSIPYRPTGTEQPRLGQYSQSERPHGSFSSETTGAQPQFPSGSGQGQVFPDKQGRGEYSREGKQNGQFPIGQGGYTRSQGGQLPSSGVSQPSGSLVGQGSPTGYPQSEKPTNAQFPSGGSTQVSGPSERPGFVGQTITKQVISSGIQEQTGPLERQRSNGYPSTTTSDQTSGLKPEVFPVTGGPSRPQLPSGTSTASQKRPSSAGYQSYLPPEQPGTGGLPLAEVPTSRFPSIGFTSIGSRPQPGYESVGGSSSPSGPGGELSQPQTGYGRTDISTGGVSNGNQPSGPRTGTGLPRQPTRLQNEYEATGTTASPGQKFPSRFPEQPTRNQNGHDITPGTGKIPFESKSQTTDDLIESGPEQGTNGFGKSSTPQQFGRPGSTGRSEPGYSLNQAIQEGFPRRTGGRAFPGFQQGTSGFLPNQQEPSDETGAYDEEDEGDFSAIPGEPGRDYPILSDIPETSFACDAQEFRGYYADIETRCQIFHICSNNRTYDFICPNGTIFHQENLVCVWWNQFDCETAPSLYRINEHIYDFSIFGAQQTGGIPLPGQDFPEFPEGQPSFTGRTPGAGVVGQGPQTAVQRPGGNEAPGYSRYPSQRPHSPRLLSDENGYSSDGSQAPTGASSTGYPSGTQQETGGYQTPAGGFQRPGSNGQTPSGSPSQGAGGYQTPTGGFQRSGSNGQTPSGSPPQGAGGYQTPTGVFQRPGSNGQTPSGSPSQGSGGYQTPTEGFQSPSGNDKTPGGHTSERPQGPTYPSSTGYPIRTPPGTEGYQVPVGGNVVQRPVGSQGTSTGLQRPGSGIQRPVEESQGPTEYNLTGYNSGRPGYTGREPKSQGFLTGSDMSAPPARPGQYERDGISRPLLPLGSQTTTAPGGDQSNGYPTGTSPRPSSSPGSQSSGVGRPGLPFPGSPQPHEPTREYLPPV